MRSLRFVRTTGAPDMAASSCSGGPGGRSGGAPRRPVRAFPVMAGLMHGLGAGVALAGHGPAGFDAGSPGGLSVALDPAYRSVKVDDRSRSSWGEVSMAAGIQASQLLGRWFHSHEESQGDRLVFRPADFAFPPSRGRTALVFGQGGDLQVEGPGPDDRRRATSGRWSLQGNVLTTAAPGWSGAFTIDSVDEHALVLRRRP